MNFKISSLLLFSIFISVVSFAQTSSIKGKVLSRTNNEAIPFAPVIVQSGAAGGVTDENGEFVIPNILPGLYNLECQAVGYKKAVVFEIEVTLDRPAIVQILMDESTVETGTVEVVASGISNAEESPVSIRTIGVNEIKRSPGSGRDISKAIRSLPGVTITPSFRNDILIRGGAANENRFFLDGIEIPNINHFATQGASGGPVGMLNVDLIQEVEFYSGAFPAARGNALSSVFEFEVKEARKDKYTANFVVGSSDLAIATEGPTGKNSGLIISARRSYLQGLFRLLELPFLPTYNDFQFKWKTKLDDRNQITILGLGAIDQFDLNLSLADDTTSENYLRNNYLLSNLPINTQWNYTVGSKWDHYTDNGRVTVVLSRNALQNNAFKYINNDENLARTLDYSSRETENKFRVEHKINGKSGWKTIYGVSSELAQFTVNNKSDRYIPASDTTVRFVYATSLNLVKYGLFIQSSKTMLRERLVLSAGMRADGTDFNDEMSNPFNQFSPRISASYRFAPQWSFNMNTGIYYQLPAYTVLGFVQDGVNLNKDARYIGNTQAVAGVKYDWDKRNTTISLEGFYKEYKNYPVSVNNNISLANLGADFGVVGNEAIRSAGLGRAYGLEFLYQQKLYKGVYGILSYTYVRSEFSNFEGKFVPSSWDSRHLISVTGGWRFGKNWEIGGRFLFSGGLPFTPDNVAASININNWNQLNAGIPDYTRLNSQRINAFHQLDVRVDKRWFFSKWSLNLFLEVLNIYNNVTPTKPTLDVVRDSQGLPIPDPNNPGSYIPNFLDESTGSLLPSIGIIIEL